MSRSGHGLSQVRHRGGLAGHHAGLHAREEVRPRVRAGQQHGGGDALWQQLCRVLLHQLLHALRHPGERGGAGGLRCWACSPGRAGKAASPEQSNTLGGAGAGPGELSHTLLTHSWLVPSSLRTGGCFSISGTLMRSEGRVVDSVPCPRQPCQAAGCEGELPAHSGVHAASLRGAGQVLSQESHVPGSGVSMVPCGWPFGSPGLQARGPDSPTYRKGH